MSSCTQIVATIGPASASEETLYQMMTNGMDVARLNFSHGTYPSQLALLFAIRAASARAGKKVPVIQDLAGPRVKLASGHGFDAAGACVTEKDIEDLAFGIREGMDYIAQSFVGSAGDVACLKGEITRLGSKVPVIAKIERKEAVDAIQDIVEIADAVMVARGDLGSAVAIEDIPFIERDIITAARRAGKPVITATQMLYTMVENREPTRAEVTDVAYAIVSGSDAVMLSEETAVGKNPVLAVSTMERIASRAEAISNICLVNAL